MARSGSGSRLALLVFAASCGGNAPLPMPPSNSVAAGAHSPLPACIPTTITQLESYWDVQLHTTYWIDMARDPQGAWIPLATISMPHHHATALSLENLAAFPDLARVKTGVVRFVLEVTSRDIEKSPHEHQWFTTYHARILELCISRSAL